MCACCTPPQTASYFRISLTISNKHLFTTRPFVANSTFALLRYYLRKLGDLNYPNAGVIGKFKDELNLDFIVKFVRLRSKNVFHYDMQSNKMAFGKIVYTKLHLKELQIKFSITNIRRSDPDYYVCMYRRGIDHVIVNSRISFKGLLCMSIKIILHRN